jgi:hypothetical protein
VLNKIPEQVLPKAVLILTKPWGLGVCFFAAFLFLLSALSAVSLLANSNWLLAAAAVGAALITLTASALLRPPKFSHDQIGLLLAIRADSKEAQDRVETDIATALLDSLRETGSSLSFSVLPLQQFHARNVVTIDAAKYYTAKTNARFTLFGSISKRASSGGDQFILRVDALVTHSPISDEDQSALANEMQNVLPLRTKIDVSKEFEGFELTGRLFGLGAQYVISVVLFVSGDSKASIEALSSLSKKLEKTPHRLSGSAQNY